MLSSSGYSSGLTNDFRIGFLDENKWMLVEGVCKRDNDVLSQTAGPSFNLM